ncbi:Ig-like domain-containing protein [Macrococcus brunensis]|uniref:Ig-like domain-containing protein n=1 Tax=Macrococcus brunensis TaxID=198483 RepID=UPI001EF099AC|nr:Ig-like domain-containing protein [Macrococcus brunensis]ULG72715.1 Ig-like domain-containing protein [Macrococcus brunensis]
MKDQLIKYMMVLLILVTLFPYSGQAVAATCEQTVFKLTSPKTQDKKIMGSALADKMLVIKVNETEYPLTVKSDGTYELLLSTPLLADDKVQVEQGMNKLTADVVTESAEEEIVLDGPFDCTGLVDEPTTETATTQESTEEPTTETVTTEAGTTEEPTTETVTTEAGTTEEPTTETATTEESTEEPTTETATTEELTEESTTETATTEEPTEEPTTETATTEEPTEEPTTETPTTEESTEEPTVESVVMQEEPLMPRTFSLSLAPSTTVRSLTTSSTCPTVSEYNAANNTGVFNKAVTGKIVCVSTAAEFDSAVKDATVEVVILKNNISTSTAQTVNGSTGMKVIDVNNFALQLGNSEGLRVPAASSVNELIIQNAANLINTAASAERGFASFEDGKVSQLKYSNVTYNSANQGSSHLGAGYDSTLHFYGKNTATISGPEFMARYSNVIVHDGALLDITSPNNGFLFKNVNVSSVANTGLNIGNNATVNIKATSGDVLHFDSNRPYKVRVGQGSTMNLSGNKGIYVNLSNAAASQMSNIIFDAGSTVNINTNANAFKFNNDPVTIDVNSSANVTLKSASDVIYANASSNPVTVNVKSNGKLIFEKTGTSTSEAINVSRPFTYNIDSAAKVDFINPTGQIFTKSNVMTFNITNMAVRSWLTDVSKTTPDKQTAIIASGSFKMQSATTAISGMPANFNTDFAPTMRRLQFVPETAVPNPQKTIYDDAKTITGTAPAGSTVTMKNTRTNTTQTVTADSSGNFTFNVTAGSLLKDDVLQFTATQNGYTSSAVSRTVTGTVLELVQPADIIFKTTTIQDKPGLIIQRETPVDYSVRVKDTKTSGSWNVTVQATKQMTNSQGEVLNDALVFKEGTTYSSLKSAVKVTDKTKAAATATAGEVETKWTSDNGVLLRTNPLQATTDTYTGTLTWTLTSGP